MTDRAPDLHHPNSLSPAALPTHRSCIRHRLRILSLSSAHPAQQTDQPLSHRFSSPTHLYHPCPIRDHESEYSNGQWSSVHGRRLLIFEYGLINAGIMLLYTYLLNIAAGVGLMFRLDHFL